MAMAFMSAAPARAALILGVETFSEPSPSTGDFLEVYLTNTGPAVTVDSFTFGLSMTDPNFTFTSVTIGTVPDTYIFAGNSLFGPTISTTATVDSVIASDIWGGAGNGFTVGTSATVGLGEIFFDVASGAATAPVSFAAIQTSLSDIGGNPILIDSENPGTITISGTVPEPSTLVLFGSALAALVAAKRRHGSA
jgi:hypothetical protein